MIILFIDNRYYILPPPLLFSISLPLLPPFIKHLTITAAVAATVASAEYKVFSSSSRSNSSGIEAFDCYSNSNSGDSDSRKLRREVWRRRLNFLPSMDKPYIHG